MSATKTFPATFLTPATTGEAVLAEFNAEAAKALAGFTLPTRKTENWKYSSRHLALAEVLAETNSAVELPDERHLVDVGGYRIVFTNGKYDRAASRLPESDELTVQPFAAMDSLSPTLVRTLHAVTGNTEFPFATLNATKLVDGVLIRIASNRQIVEPVQVIYDHCTTTPGSAHARVVVEAGDNSKVTIIEEYTGPADIPLLTSAVTQFILGKQAKVTHIRLCMEPEATQHIGLTTVAQNRDSQFLAHNIGFGGKLRRHDINVKLLEPGGFSLVNGIYLTRDSQHYDNHTRLEHIAPHCESSETYRGIADDSSHAVFNGQILIQRDAQKSLANMSNKNLLLSSGAEIDTKPELEIYADDVKCSHGATIGQLDDDALFYLVSRGISSDTAASMLSMGFINELLEQVPNEKVRTLVTEQLIEFLNRSFAGSPEAVAERS
ncbi:MAG: Fe-S cluster assembly protein SufD [Gammaproteobacteria bacterium]|nr:MAG: Fe-S cluster assembly protein SufD [Gammaproteobacteria bacterium]